MKETKTVDGHYRAMLLQTFSQMKLSELTELKIALIINKCDKSIREQKAKEILEDIKSCKTEEEVIKKLKLYPTRALTLEMVQSLAAELKQLGISMEIAIGIVHMLDTEEQAKQILEFMKTNQPTEQEVLHKLDEILTE